ncbi:MAG TPA: DUF3365 domain-containing protein [Thiomicrospira sp.]|nr:DUF3365 domain-containing protein [Thiomicrospira sp.]
MKIKIMTRVILAASLSSFFTSNAIAADTATANMEEARGLVKQFAGQLKPELKKAMKAGGPVAAVEFCHAKAPVIAKNLADKSGWNVSRVSLKARGAMATPDVWETAVLNKFNEKKAAGEPVKTMEFSEVTHEAGQKTFRYMKAIGTAEVCLTCHGTNVAEPIKQAIAKYYPQDNAMGFKKGDIRGAFSFSKVVK